MAIAFNCAKCGAKVRVGDEFAGRTGKCPGCKSPVKIPAASPPEPPRKRPPPQKSGTGKAADSGAFDFGAPMDLRGNEEGPPSSRARRRAAPPPEDEPLLLEEAGAEDDDEPVEFDEVEESAPRRRGSKATKVGSSGAWAPVGGGAMFVLIGVGVLGLGFVLTLVNTLLPDLLEPGDLSVDTYKIYLLLMAVVLVAGVGLMLFGKFPVMSTPSVDDAGLVGFGVLGSAGLALIAFLSALIGVVLLLAEEQIPDVLGTIAAAKWPLLFAAELVFLAYLAQLAAAARNDSVRGAAGNGLLVAGGLIIAVSILGIFIGLVDDSLDPSTLRLERPQTREEAEALQKKAEDLRDARYNVQLANKILEILFQLAALGLYAKSLWTVRTALGGGGGFTSKPAKKPKRRSRPEPDEDEDEEFEDFEEVDDEPPPPPRGRRPRGRR